MEHTAPLVALSLGWGVQSFGLAAMSALGELPKVDVAIHADTTHEREATYRFAERWTPWLEEHGVKVVAVQPAARAAVAYPTRKETWAVNIPAFTKSPDSDGQIKRQCTGTWKLRPIRKWLQARRAGHPVEMWLGITTDEIGRVKPSDVGYVTNRWPFIERRWRRSDVMAWLGRHDLEIPPKSACVFCPFASNAAWRALQGTEDWAKAVAVDEQVRAARPPFDLFLHASRIPLAQVDLRSEQERGQMALDGFDNECSGHCGL